jgi:hypothetical protein
MMNAATSTACRKCKAPMPPLVVAVGAFGMQALPLRVTAYRRPSCGHFNDLKRRNAERSGPAAQDKL